MDTELSLTVREALQRPLFANARLVAGERGAARLIRWVHILESSSSEKLIHGDEMILTTGMSFTLESFSPMAFMDNLIRQNAACLCIEMGPYFDRVPELLVDLANRFDFPLVVFPHVVRFVDITQDLHSLIINRHHRTLRELESISREFYRMTLHASGIHNVLKLLHRSTQNPIIYRPRQGNPVYLPAMPSEVQDVPFAFDEPFWESLADLKPNDAPDLRDDAGLRLMVKPIGVSDQTWAHVVMICRRKPQEYDFLLMESAALAIAQELLRTRYVEERRLFSENRWVDELMNGRLQDEQAIQALVGPDFKAFNELHYRVCLIEVANFTELQADRTDQDWASVGLHLSLLLRPAFEKFSFRPLIAWRNNRLAVIALDLKSKHPAKSRLQQALESLAEIGADDRLRDLDLSIGVSQPHIGLKHAYAGFREAIHSLSLRACFRKPLLFYDELGVYRLLLGLNDGDTLQTFVRAHLGPLIDHDRSKGSELLRTLKVYLDHDGSKQIAAQKLFIVRQSLYYRLEKMAELLGEDFMSPENRISMQVALRAYQLLQPELFDSLQAE